MADSVVSGSNIPNDQSSKNTANIDVKENASVDMTSNKNEDVTKNCSESPSNPKNEMSLTTTEETKMESLNELLSTKGNDVNAKDEEDIQAKKRRERLEQNRISARESRKRKKNMIEELQRNVISLSRENKELTQANDNIRRQLIDIGTKHPGSVPLQVLMACNEHQQQQPQQQHDLFSATHSGPAMTIPMLSSNPAGMNVPVSQTAPGSHVFATQMPSDWKNSNAAPAHPLTVPEKNVESGK